MTEIETAAVAGQFFQILHLEIFWDHDELLIAGRVKADWLTGWTLIDLWVLFWVLELWASEGPEALDFSHRWRTPFFLFF